MYSQSGINDCNISGLYPRKQAWNMRDNFRGLSLFLFFKNHNLTHYKRVQHIAENLLSVYIHLIRASADDSKLELTVDYDF